MRGGIYEPYRQHFPLKTQQTNYDVDQYYSTWTPDHPNNQNAQQQKFGPKLMTASASAITTNGGLQNNLNNYQQHVIPNQYEQHNIQQQLQQHQLQQQQLQQQQQQQQYQQQQQQQIQQASALRAAAGSPYQHNTNYPQTNIAKFGEGNALVQNSTPQYAASEAYDNHQLPGRNVRAASFNLGSYTNHNLPQTGGIRRSGSNASLSGPSYGNVYPLVQRPGRPSSALLPTRSASDVGFLNNRPIRPGSATHGFTDSNQVMQSQTVRQDYEVASSLSNPIAAQLRGSQANLQNALRMHEEASRQAGAAPAPELEATMKIMQTCLDMLDSISGLVERSTTPLPQELNKNMNRINNYEKQNFINHLNNNRQKPPKSALKRPNLQKSQNSAFTQLRNGGTGDAGEDSSSPESSEGYGGDTPSPKPTWNITDHNERDISDFNSPGPSEGGTSVDSGFVKAKLQPTLLKQTKTNEQEMAERRARNLAKFETLIRNGHQSFSKDGNDVSQGQTEQQQTKSSSNTLLSSLSQLRLNDI